MLVQRTLDIPVRCEETCVPAVLVGVTGECRCAGAGRWGGACDVAGVVVGAVLARRAQIAQRSRDRQVEACVSILRESTRAQISLLRLYLGERLAGSDWAPWNEAMAVIQLVGHSDMAAAVHRMDEVFWRSNFSIEHGEVTTHLHARSGGPALSCMMSVPFPMAPDGHRTSL